jgi:hypothetical protein
VDIGIGINTGECVVGFGVVSTSCPSSFKCRRAQARKKRGIIQVLDQFRRDHQVKHPIEIEILRITDDNFVALGRKRLDRRTIIIQAENGRCMVADMPVQPMCARFL